MPVKPTRTAQYVLQNGAVLLRQGTKLVPLSQNIRLPNGTKVNVKSGIVELPGGKITTLHEGDYVKADGGIVFATPGAAAAARGDKTVSSDATYTPYVQKGTAAAAPLNNREQLLLQKIDLLNRKVTLLQATPNAPSTAALDQELREVDSQLAGVK